MIETALNEVKGAEKEAERLVEDEKQKAAKLVAEVRNKSSQYVKNSGDELARKKAQLIERQKEKIMAAREKALADGMDKLKLLKRSAEKKTAEAAEMVVEAFEKEVMK